MAKMKLVCTLIQLYSGEIETLIGKFLQKQFGEVVWEAEPCNNDSEDVLSWHVCLDQDSNSEELLTTIENFSQERGLSGHLIFDEILEILFGKDSEIEAIGLDGVQIILTERQFKSLDPEVVDWLQELVNNTKEEENID